MDTRTHETPNAVMTTLASPTLNGAAVAVWRVEMTPGAVGPAHLVDVDQVLTVETGTLEIELEGAVRAVDAGETVLLRAGAHRRVRATGATTMRALVASAPRATASTADRSNVPVPWAA